ncbi:MAG: hypothetical protein D6723_16390 [Acidobacteria bacterium]|nr:MAG: hypothetical protein D6723_16390 [Acidobacteriota bacterium]
MIAGETHDIGLRARCLTIEEERDAHPLEPRSLSDRCCGQALGRLVPVSSTRYRAYTPGLSTWSSSRGLTC